jgi:dsRNA-specific ribonuclease
LLGAALTHASARQASAVDYQRLEFLGDRVLGLLVAEMLYAEYPEATEGELSLRLNALVNAETLAAIADETGISELIRSSGEVRAARKQVNVRADVMEALIAVLYLDQGLEAAREFIKFLEMPIAHEIWMAQSGLLTPLKTANKEAYANEQLKKQGDILVNASTFRFDGSDLMPGKIGAGAFWTGMIDLVGGKPAADVAADIQKSWDAIK